MKPWENWTLVGAMGCGSEYAKTVGRSMLGQAAASSLRGPYAEGNRRNDGAGRPWAECGALRGTRRALQIVRRALLPLCRRRTFRGRNRASHMQQSEETVQVCKRPEEVPRSRGVLRGKDAMGDSVDAAT